MFRTIFTLALSLLLVAEASAQTGPEGSAAPTTKSAKATARSSRRAAKKARRIALKSAPALPRVNAGWPALEEAAPAVAAVEPVGGYGAAGASSRGEIDNANVYAAPGMPVHMRTGNGLTPYSVRPARKPAAQTTLSTGN